MSVRLISVTPWAERTMAYVARVSSPNQDNPDFAKLLAYCIRKGHWSVFEHAHMTLEISTSRMISPQILRHWSARFQEFSQRYSQADSYVPYEARRQDTKNRQNSIDDLTDEVKQEWLMRQQRNWARAKEDYDWAIENNIAKECARAVLPLQTATKMYMTMNARDWINYINLRTSEESQLEHREIAEQCKKVFIEEFPTVSEALGWS